MARPSSSKLRSDRNGELVRARDSTDDPADAVVSAVPRAAVLNSESSPATVLCTYEASA